ncbi:MAG: hypothetical protein PVH88_14675 [Ignavibacteria bacterium]|jgi:hypothetical protein
MNEICIPIPHFGENQIAEVEVTVNGKKKKYNFRVESFPWKVPVLAGEIENEVNETQLKIENLRHMLDEYNHGWEIVQIFTPREHTEYIQVLFRQKKQL